MPYPKKSAESRAIAVARHKAAKWKRIKFRDNRLPETKSADVGTYGECWCGETMNHDWPGRDQGNPHPMTDLPPGLPPKVAEREAQIALQEAGVCPICRGYPGVSRPFLDFGSDEEIPRCTTCYGTGTFPPPKSTKDLPSIRCPKCKMVSYNPNDIREGYCGNCHAYLDDPN